MGNDRKLRNGLFVVLQNSAAGQRASADRSTSLVTTYGSLLPILSRDMHTFHENVSSAPSRADYHVACTAREIISISYFTFHRRADITEKTCVTKDSQA